MGVFLATPHCRCGVPVCTDTTQEEQQELHLVGSAFGVALLASVLSWEDAL
jgi:hypothetical protein